MVKDPLELSNLAADVKHSDVLLQLQTTYDQAVTAWKQQAVTYHNYQAYGNAFDRSIPWTP